jgi:DNA helicase HerA-like ATPase
VILCGKTSKRPVEEPMFIAEMEGTLMELAEAPETRFRYIIWFDYTRRAINEIQEGTLLAVPNFASDSSTRRYSVLEVTTILPTHYALHGGGGGYPGFVVEAARSAASDWESQESTSTEDTTKIRVVAMPTNLEIAEPLDGDPSVLPESNIAMVGSKVHILDTEYSNLIANNGIDPSVEQNLTIIGTMTRDEEVKILLRIEELYRTHFAIFGFTGVGKSNLLSTIVSKVFADASQPLKLVFFDLMSEYTTLLLDQFLGDRVKGRILSIGRHTLPEGLFKHINGLAGAPPLDEAARQFERYTLLPKALVKDKPLVGRALRDVIGSKVLGFFHDAQSLSVFDLFFTDRTPWGKERRGANLPKRSEVAKTVLRAHVKGDYKQTVFSPELARGICEGLQRALAQDGTFAEDYGPILSKLQELEAATGESYAAGVTLAEIVKDLNDPAKASLWVIQAHNPHELREFSKRLGEAVYESRRQEGLIDPLVSFIFDEADEFIRRDGAGSYAESAAIAETLARRGRKFGLGIGIATQRIRYLETNIMSQPHTYFISKLPRLSDRQAVAEAFGMSEELLNQTFKFKKGQWLLMSHDATGLEAVPIPVKTPDANVRLSQWLHERYGGTRQGQKSQKPAAVRGGK